jgi:hypothetical protein
MQLFKCHTLKQHQLMQLKKVRWFTAIHSDRKEVTGSMITENAKSFYNEININDKRIL